MTHVEITVPQRSYMAVIDQGLLARAGALLQDVSEDRRLVFVITVPPVRRRWGKGLVTSLAAAGFTPKVVEMPDGERHKKLATVERLASRLTHLGADRGAILVALGGGVVGDVTGLLASLYMRGVELVQIPTTVLAQVDASIGGKTGVNLQGGKNLLGTFHQPLAVWIDPMLLSTLPEREFRAGLFEALKCGVIGRPELFLRLEQIDARALRRDAAALEWIITESVRLKAEIVSCDERENGLRRVLNFGHTIGHALEAESGYRRFLHGEAVAWGMIAAAYIAATVNQCSGQTATRIANAVLRLGPLPKVLARSSDILRLLQRDKKTRTGVVHFVLPTEIGKTRIVRDVPEKVILEALNQVRKLSAEN